VLLEDIRLNRTSACFQEVLSHPRLHGLQRNIQIDKFGGIAIVLGERSVPVTEPTKTVRIIEDNVSFSRHQLFHSLERDGVRLLPFFDGKTFSSMQVRSELMSSRLMQAQPDTCDNCFATVVFPEKATPHITNRRFTLSS
jgi:hypothetical protein